MSLLLWITILLSSTVVHAAITLKDDLIDERFTDLSDFLGLSDEYVTLNRTDVGNAAAVALASAFAIGTSWYLLSDNLLALLAPSTESDETARAAEQPGCNCQCDRHLNKR